MLDAIIWLIFIVLLNGVLLRFHIEYNGQTEGNDKSNCIYDVGHSYLPHLEKTTLITGIKDLITSIPILYAFYYLPYKLKRSLIIDLTLLYISRAVMNNSTILPSTKKCKLNKNKFFTGCCDLLFSGHTSSALLASLYIIYYINPKYSKFLLAYNIINSLIIIMGKYHYTCDVIMAWFMCFFIFSLSIRDSSRTLMKMVFSFI